jgi:hypothetical protein
VSAGRSEGSEGWSSEGVKGRRGARVKE